MGSSPVTATIDLPSGPRRLVGHLTRFFTEVAPVDSGDRLLIAFSGGPDSLALAWTLQAATRDLGIELHGIHLDHGLDPESGTRAAAAQTLAARIDLPLTTRRLASPAQARGLEAAAREARYRALDHARDRLQARFVVTAHHRDDQLETVLLRLLFGSGLAGLGAMLPVRGYLTRPLLDWTRADLESILEACPLQPIDDPTNRDLRRPRNRLRHRVLPALSARDRDRLESLARAARGAAQRIDGVLAPLFAVDSTPAIDLEGLRGLPRPLLPWALARLHREAGTRYPPPASAVQELARQLALGRLPRCDCGGGRRWVTRQGRLALTSPTARTPRFAYTLQVPGEVTIEELDCTLTLRREPIAEWMRQGARNRAAFSLPADGPLRFEVRNRRPGDRLSPFGRRQTRRLKEVLIDRKVPREARDRIPLLCSEDRIVWVPGITIDHRFRLREGDTEAWVAEIRQESPPEPERGD